MINLRDISVSTREIEVVYEGMPNFKITLAYMSRAQSKKVVEASKKGEWVNGQLVHSQNEDLFTESFVKEAIKGWTGLTLGDVEKLMLVDFGDQDPNTPIEFSIDNAVMLMRESTAFDSFINRTVFHLDSFRSKTE
ncbi:tape measure chaperone [Pectobacterium phage DU_PP_V]|uniref:Tape measure chaperone n=1 Tax=Pectobacterium phage DU_PP_V TaxID=2041492 RepID=A0A2D2W729_9CAUD|nr:tape measure chaperone [Pectobacterium phage DU_PP_V]ATS94098.1 tape measure chaperone [Pectobacterium phage DU_PP_V]